MDGMVFGVTLMSYVEARDEAVVVVRLVKCEMGGG